VRFNSDWVGYAPDFGNAPTHDLWASWEGRDGLPARGRLSLGSYSAVILSKDRW
jgi:1,4-alpha-glucan branching enzyme